MKIEFITPQLKNYRFVLFQRLNKKYTIKFIFTNQQEKDFGGLKIPKSLNFEIIDLCARSVPNYITLAKALLRDKYDLILTSPAESEYNLLAIMVARLRFKKIIFWGEAWYWPHNTVILKLYFYFIIKLMLKKGDAIIAMGEKPYAFYKKTLMKQTGIFCAPKYVVPYKKRNPTELIDNLSLIDKKIKGKKIVLFMGRIVRIKGLDYLIKAFKSLENKFDNVYLLIVGSGPFEESCRQLAKELSVRNIMFKGYIPETDSQLIELYYNACSVLVLPSIFLNDSPEANGYVVYESMSVGKPLIVTDAVGATPEFVRDGVNGFVVRNRNVQDLVDAMSKILAEDDLQERMSNKSREIFEERISLEKQFDIFKNAVESVKGSRTYN